MEPRDHSSKVTPSCAQYFWGLAVIQTPPFVTLRESHGIEFTDREDSQRVKGNMTFF